MEKVSIVIPAHNEEEFLPATITAALAQDYPDFEIIVVDNASIDRTSEVARSFGGVTVVYEPNKGLLHARERGRREASGEIIVNMDADCLPEPDWLSRGAAHLHDPAVVAATGPYYYYDGGRIFRAFSFYSQKYVYRVMNRIIQAFNLGAVLIGGNSFIRAEALEKAGGYNTALLFYGEDTDTARRVSRHGRVIFDPNLFQSTSARRIKAEGAFTIPIRYVFHFFKVLYTGNRQKKAQ
ncbi:MAG: glycosyltransferase family 2 protein [Patescibacteria group bacterium]|nr:glycosyltransferase family 2 protein [Patescibacteria group bacterium]MDE2116316.1 glycosyltransferase family 2 protein [Patescibacteria group bacterium]